MVALAAGCGRTPPSIDAVAEGYVRVALKLAQHDATLVEAWRGPEAFEPGPRVPAAESLKDIVELQRQLDTAMPDLSSAAEEARGRYLTWQLRGLRFAAERQMGRAAGIDEQGRDEFRLIFTTVDAAAIQRTLSELDRLLAGPGSLVDRLMALRRRTSIPHDRKAAVMDIALEACRAAVAPLLTLPADEKITVLFRKNMGWDAYAQYPGNHHTILDINDDGPLDVARAFRLACHEGYPGHHVQHLLIDRWYDEGRRPELGLTPAFGRHLLLLEGAAEVGADLALPADRRAALYRERLLPAAGLAPADADLLARIDDLLPALLPVVTDVARRYLDSTITQEQAIERLGAEALVANPAATLAFIGRRRARALVYGEGRRVIYSMMPTKDLDGLRALIQNASALQ